MKIIWKLIDNRRAQFWSALNESACRKSGRLWLEQVYCSALHFSPSRRPGSLCLLSGPGVVLLSRPRLEKRNQFTIAQHGGRSGVCGDTVGVERAVRNRVAFCTVPARPAKLYILSDTFCFLSCREEKKRHRFAIAACVVASCGWRGGDVPVLPIPSTLLVVLLCSQLARKQTDKSFFDKKRGGTDWMLWQHVTGPTKLWWWYCVRTETEGYGVY